MHGEGSGSTLTSIPLYPQYHSLRRLRQLHSLLEFHDRRTLPERQSRKRRGRCDFGLRLLLVREHPLDVAARTAVARDCGWNV